MRVRERVCVCVDASACVRKGQSAAIVAHAGGGGTWVVSRGKRKPSR
jgi:hypothetical protein